MRTPLLLVSLAIAAAAPAVDSSSAAPRATPPPPPLPRSTNVIVFFLDDANKESFDFMPYLQRELVARGVVFDKAFVAASVCCPSRASLLTGRYSVTHGVLGNQAPVGGSVSFLRSGAETRTIATLLREKGYRTAFIGKYLNGYGTPAFGDSNPRVPPGWDRWLAYWGATGYGGSGIPYGLIDEALEITAWTAYSTDLFGEELRRFIDGAHAAGQPFLAVVAPYAPHVDTTSQLLPVPADRHLGRHAALAPSRPPNFGIRPGLRHYQELPWPADGYAYNDLARQRAMESLLAVDEQIELTVERLASLGILKDTVIIVTSDNGAAYGAHGGFGLYKTCPYTECNNVPLVIYGHRRVDGPRVVREPVLIIDIAPTVAAWAGITGAAFDGRDLSRFLRRSRRPPPDAWRGDFLLEYGRSNLGDTLSYVGQPLDGERVRLYYGKLLDLPRASALFEFDRGDGVGPGAIRVPLGPDDDATFFNLQDAINYAMYLKGVKGVVAGLDKAANRMPIYEVRSPRLGVLLWNETGSRSFSTPRVTPWYFGVYDAANEYLWVEYETEERELYDLRTDPWQVSNQAENPAYSGVRARLEARLREHFAQLGFGQEF